MIALYVRANSELALSEGHRPKSNGLPPYPFMPLHRRLGWFHGPAIALWSSSSQRRQRWLAYDTYGPNVGGNTVSDKNQKLKDLIDGLNQDLAGEYNAIISYLQYSAKVRGQSRPQLVEFLQAEIPDEQRHAQYLADKISSLGGEPVVEPAPVKTSDSTEQMLKYIYEAEAATVENYLKRIDQAEAAGEIGLKVQLEEFLSDETTHRDEVRKILDGWSS